MSSEVTCKNSSQQFPPPPKKRTDCTMILLLEATLETMALNNSAFTSCPQHMHILSIWSTRAWPDVSFCWLQAWALIPWAKTDVHTGWAPCLCGSPQCWPAICGNSTVIVGSSSGLRGRPESFVKNNPCSFSTWPKKETEGWPGTRITRCRERG